LFLYRNPHSLQHPSIQPAGHHRPRLHLLRANLQKMILRRIWILKTVIVRKPWGRIGNGINSKMITSVEVGTDKTWADQLLY
jgi:hypothetical protein